MNRCCSLAITLLRRLQIVATCFVALVIFARAVRSEQLYKWTASDGAGFDHFGYQLAIEGNKALVGAYLNTNHGAAYLFDATTGAQVGKLTASDAGVGDGFGNDVAISGSLALIGSFADDSPGLIDSGSAYLFDLTTGQQLRKFTASDAGAGDQFGISVALSGNLALVGARFDDAPGSNSGAAYLFDVTTGQQLWKITASDAGVEDTFGYSVALSGTTALVGAHRNDDAGTNSGSAYVFNTTTGQQLYKLTATDANGGDEFGVSVSLDGTKAIIGARGDDDIHLDAGSAYIFDVTTGQQLLKLHASDADVADSFGESVTIHGNLGVVGAIHNNDAGTWSGSAYLFNVDTGQQLDKYVAADAAARDEFGIGVAVSDQFALVGSWKDGDKGAESGSAYLFSVVPEPSTIQLLILGAILLVRRVGRKCALACI